MLAVLTAVLLITQLNAIVREQHGTVSGTHQAVEEVAAVVEAEGAVVAPALVMEDFTTIQ